MNHMLGVIIESLVAMLLVLTIGYCMVLNKRLMRLRADEQSLKAVIAEEGISALAFVRAPCVPGCAIDALRALWTKRRTLPGLRL